MNNNVNVGQIKLGGLSDGFCVNLGSSVGAGTMISIPWPWKKSLDVLTFLLICFTLF